MARPPSPRRPNPVFGDDYALIRRALFRARRRAGMTQRALADRLGRSHSHVARIEAGQRRVDVLDFYLTARALGTDPIALFASMARQLDARSEIDDAEGLAARAVDRPT